MNITEVKYILLKNGIQGKSIWDPQPGGSAYIILAGRAYNPDLESAEALEFYTRIREIFHAYKSKSDQRSAAFLVSLYYGKILIRGNTFRPEFFSELELKRSPASWEGSLPEPAESDLLINLTPRQITILSEYEGNDMLDPGTLVRVESARSVQVKARITDDLVSTVLSGVDRNSNSGDPEARGELNTFGNLLSKIERILAENGKKIDEWGDEEMIIPADQPLTQFKY